MHSEPHIEEGTTAGEHLYSIGEIARLTGVSQGLLRLWEREGLISPQRTPGGHRYYSFDDLARLRQITHLRRVEGLNTAAIRRELGSAEKTIASETTENELNLGLRLRALRIEQSLSLAEIAERTGLSISFLSAVERGQSSISLGNLFKLADAYGTTVPGLSSEHRGKHNSNMLHPEDRPRFVANHGLVVIEDLITRSGALEAQRIEIQPGGGSEEPYAHPGEEFIYIIAGQLEFWINGNDHYNLQTGDSLYFFSTQLHHWRNTSDSPATVLWINVPIVDISGSNERHIARQRAHEIC
ncbi:MerR family transcriptional regulator [Ktedonosporobacter rubrisoli]|uniref:MerR family transcriptional regulator n=1 Tax=Ktedonosporobacter rubrisoli TaxID=2509675 RepID=A0A4P6K571_KTERU|nr:MerR family transcriptional regulator [Ktedonosporobacter rubrisoli]QBD83093.1 MerR family transcriptional regulator [Ktedonosporobacter rubrisoli]